MTKGGFLEAFTKEHEQHSFALAARFMVGSKLGGSKAPLNGRLTEANQ